MNKQSDKTNSRLGGSGILLLTAFIWGMAFIAQSTGMDHIGPFTMNCTRSVLGGLTLLPLVIGKQVKKEAGQNIDWRATVIGGVCCGAVLAVASSLQQIGICYTTVGKAGFITTLYIVMVPLTGVFRHKRIGGRIWVSVMLAATGMYLLCMNESFSVNPGDFYVFCCAAAFTVHILVIDHFSPKTHGTTMYSVQFFTCALLCGAAMLIFEKPMWSNIYAARASILYAGIFSSGVGYTLQIIGQKRTEPVLASLIMSLESVFAALGGWFILGQTLDGRELAGCAVVFAGIILAQLPERKNVLKPALGAEHKRRA